MLYSWDPCTGNQTLHIWKTLRLMIEKWHRKSEGSPWPSNFGTKRKPGWHHGNLPADLSKIWCVYFSFLFFFSFCWALMGISLDEGITEPQCIYIYYKVENWDYWNIEGFQKFLHYLLIWVKLKVIPVTIPFRYKYFRVFSFIHVILLLIHIYIYIYINSA